MDLFNKLVSFLVLFITLWEAPTAIPSKDQEDLGEDFVISPYKTHVRVFNKLDGFNFTIHCKSKNDDVGTHVISPEKYYELSFRVNILGSTLFFCGITSKQGSREYELYNAKRDMKRCPTKCDWIATKKGLFGYRQDNGEQDISLKWSKPQYLMAGNVEGNSPAP